MLDLAREVWYQCPASAVCVMRYSISELAKKTGLSIHTLRFYEKEGIIRYVERTSSGRRVYGAASLACLIGALCLKQAKLTIPQIKEFFDMTHLGDETLAKRLEMLTTARKNLEQMRDSISRSMQLVDFFVTGGKEALQALKEGGDAASAFPFLTIDGILDFPCRMMEDGNLEPCIPTGVSGC